MRQIRTIEKEQTLDIERENTRPIKRVVAGRSLVAAAYDNRDRSTFLTPGTMDERHRASSYYKNPPAR